MNRRLNIQRHLIPLVAPLLFTLLPIVSILSQNNIDISPSYATRPIVLSITAGMAALFLFWIAFKDVCLAASATSLSLIFFFSYGHVYGGFLDPFSFTLFSYSRLIGNHISLMVVWASIWLLGIFAIHRLKRQRANIANLLVIMAIVAISGPIYMILRTEILLHQAWPKQTNQGDAGFTALETTASHGRVEERPDIYYIVLDGYARTDIIDQVYGYDNREFIKFLEDQGFYVADQARSNYGQTLLSLASSLNIDYLDNLAAQVDKGSSDRLPLARLIRHSWVRKTLEAQGYRVVNLSSGYRSTELEDADQYFAPSNIKSTSLDRLIIDTSALSAVHAAVMSLGIQVTPVGYDAHRQRIEYAIGSLPRLATEPGPKFVFVHIIAPHPPFVFGPGGEMVYSEYPFNLLDGDAFPGTREAYAKGYVDQLIYLNFQLKKTIAALKDVSHTPPIIILQADHGPGLGLIWNSADESNLNERFSILNAYYLPGKDTKVLYNAITPVNTFRVVLNLYFDMEYTLLDDKSLFATWDRPYDFIPLVLQNGKIMASP